MPKLNIREQLSKRTGTEDSRDVSLSIKDIPIGDIAIKENVRKDYTDLENLQSSIRQYGLLQPITVYRDGAGYAVKTGHRRYLAYRELYREEPDRFHSIRCIISDANNIAAVQLIENVQRVDLSAKELCDALQSLRTAGYSHKQIADFMGKTLQYIDNLFTGVNEIEKSPALAEYLTTAGGSIQDIAETKGIPDEQARVKLLKQRSAGELTRSDLREETRRLKNADKSPVEVTMVKVAYSEKRRAVTITFPEDAPTEDIVRDLKKWLTRKGFPAR